MPYCNYNKGYLVGISRLQAHSVIRVIEMVSEKPRRRRRETVLLVGPSKRSEREERECWASGYKRGRVRVFLLDVDEPEIMRVIRYRDIVYLTGLWNLKKIDSPIL